PVVSVQAHRDLRHLHPFPTRRSSDLVTFAEIRPLSRRPPWDSSSRSTTSATSRSSSSASPSAQSSSSTACPSAASGARKTAPRRSEEHTSELQSRGHIVCRLLLEGET